MRRGTLPRTERERTAALKAAGEALEAAADDLALLVELAAAAAETGGIGTEACHGLLRSLKRVRDEVCHAHSDIDACRPEAALVAAGDVTSEDARA